QEELWSLPWRHADRPDAPPGDPQADTYRPLAELDPDLDPAARTLAASTAALEAIVAHLAREVPEGEGPAPLALLVPGAAAPTDGEPPAPAAAAVAGLVRSAHAEHPGRLICVDTDAEESSRAALPAAIAAALAA